MVHSAAVGLPLALVSLLIFVDNDSPNEQRRLCAVRRQQPELNSNLRPSFVISRSIATVPALASHFVQGCRAPGLLAPNCFIS